MSNFLPYILKLSISICVIYVFYQVFLRRLTFYNWNRWYLLLYSVLCFAMPFINVFTFMTAPDTDGSSLIRFIPVIDYVPQQEATTSMDWKQITVIIVLAGIVLFMIRLLIQYLSLVKMRTKARLLYDNNIKLYHIDKPVIPFSFGNAIYINQHQHSREELSDIIRHEFIHVKQRHTVDMLWSELLCIVNWYNPFAWLLKKAIRQNLEFIADHQVLQTGFDRKQYQYLLLKVIGTSSFSIASNFNFSSLKKRIAMMNKSKSARVHLLRFLFILPMLAVILLAFRNIKQEQQIEEQLVQPQQEIPVTPVVEEPATISATRQVDTVPVKVVESIKLSEKKVTNVEIKDIKSIHVNKTGGRNTITIFLKNDDEDVFDLDNQADRDRYTEKYGGELPKVAQGKPAPRPPASLNEITVMGYGAPKPPAPLNYNCFNEKGYCITIADNNGECVVIVKNKDEKIVEAVSLADWEKNDYDQKYGKIPPAPVKIRLGRPAQPAQPAQPGFSAQPKPVTFNAKPSNKTSIAPVTARPYAVTVASKPAFSIKYVPRVKLADWTLTINRQTTAELLDGIKEALANHGHQLVINDVTHTDGQLTAFNALIISADGTKNKIQTKDIRKGMIVISGGKDTEGKERCQVEIKADKSEL